MRIRLVLLMSSMFAAAIVPAAAPAAAQTLPVPVAPTQLMTPPANKAPVVAPTVEDAVKLPNAEFPDITIRAVKIVGAEALPEDVVAAPFKGLTGKVSGVELRNALEAVGRLYSAAGFALGRAYIPPQRMKDGVLVVRVLEGRIGAVAVQTDTPRVKDTIERYAARLLESKPLRIADLDRYLRLIGEIPGVTATAKLTDMDLATGKAVLIITAQYMPISVALSLTNDGNLHSLPLQPYLSIKANDLFGTGDQFALTALLSPVPKDEYFLQGSASTLVGSDGWRVTSTTSVARARADIQPRSINLASSQLRSDLRAAYPLVKSAREQLTAAGGVYFAQLRYDLNHFHIAKDRAFSAFGEITETRQFTERWSANAFGRVTLGTQLPYENGMPTSRANAAKDFAKLNLGGAAVWSAKENWSLLARADAQAASGSLQAGEEIVFGGDRFGRGYNVGTISGDHGIGLSLQPQYSFSIAPNWTSSIFAFADYAKAFNMRGDGQMDASLVSLGGGVGLGWGGYSVSLGVGQPLQKVPFYTTKLSPRLFVNLSAHL